MRESAPGRNYHNIGLNDKPYSLSDSTDIDANVFVKPDGSWSAQVKCISRPELSTPLRSFKDQGSADHWVSKQVDIITRTTMNEVTLRKYIRDYLQLYL